MNLPTWIRTEDGALVNASAVSRFYTTGALVVCEWRVPAGIAATEICRCRCVTEAMEALSRLEKMLPIAVIDMVLDIQAPIEREANEMEPAP